MYLLGAVDNTEINQEICRQITEISSLSGITGIDTQGSVCELETHSQFCMQTPLKKAAMQWLSIMLGVRGPFGLPVFQPWSRSIPGIIYILVASP